MAVSAGASGWSGLRLACASLRSFFGLFLLLGLAPRPGTATTHWVVTEDGKIQQQVDSPMNLKHPHDLVILMRQETTVNYLKELEKQLVAQKIHIEENEDRDTGLEQRHNKEDPDCIKAKVPLGDLDLYDGTYITLESKDISPEDYVDTKSPLPLDLEEPECTKILDLPYSIHAFQHLRGIQERVNLSAPLLPKEDPVLNYLSRRLGRNIEEIGHRIYEGLLKMLGEYNHSVLCYDHALQAKPGFEQAIKRKHAVLCQQKLEQKLEAQHRSLQRTLNELKEYQKQHDHYLRQQEILEKHKLIQEEQILRNIIHETQMAKEAQLGNHQICRLGNQQHSLHCQWDQPVRYHRGDMFENVEYVEFGGDSSIATMAFVNSELQVNSSDFSHSLESSPWVHSVFSLWGLEADDYKDKQNIMWPKRSDCVKSYPAIPSPEELPTYILHPENRGQRIHSLLGNLEEDLTETEFNEPDCSSITDNPNSDSVYFWIKELSSHLDLTEKMPDDYAKQILYSRVNNQSVTQQQIGSLIYHAILKAREPLWLVLNEASLYWRALGNGTFAFTCLRKAFNLTPHEFQDIPLVNLANLLIHYGLHLDASKLLHKALAINDSEPLTFLSLGNAYLALKNVSGALQVFRNALDIATKCLECERNLKLIRCLQFYPFLYNITSSTCSGYCHEKSQDDNHAKQKYFNPQDSDIILIEETLKTAAEDDLTDQVHGSAGDSSSLTLESTVIAENNDSEEIENLGGAQMSEEMLALVDEFENSWPLEAFEGALEVKGHRMDLQGIRITFQVKRVKKHKPENIDPQEPAGRNGEEGVVGENENLYQMALEISGPKIPSPGPPGRKKDYRSLGWPSPDECIKFRRMDLTTVASTWLAVSAKNIDITEHIDFATPLQEPAMEPLCNANLPASMHTLDHLHGVANRASLHYMGESQLKEVLQNLGKDRYPPQSLEQVGTRIAKVLEKNQTSWILSSMAALYWRVKGQGKKAIDCLRQALHHTPYYMKDVPLISLANIFHNAKLWNDAIIVATMAVEIAPHFVVNHFTLANVYVAMEEFEKAMRWYESTLKLQPEFAPAKNRIRAIQCHLLMKNERHSP
ncbi:Tetratricopeptide repeat protein 17 [Ophiophagus hannah]|uniref:Tetratricopeptide repeat protein 17 n=1 Tax=Ophiophagus hannah TaxID=8665 RepID=V8P2G6_OPHHA|nr:Tetratricopeptide repeat protein 17 [Ophiophagus hannah]